MSQVRPLLMVRVQVTIGRAGSMVGMDTDTAPSTTLDSSCSRAIRVTFSIGKYLGRR
jgi:hypothetical protein